MSKLGLLSLLPPTYALVVVAVLVSSTSPVPGWLIGVHLGVIVLAGGLMFLCLNRIRLDSSLSEAQKKRWAAGVFWFGLFVIPVYLLTHSTRARTSEQGTGTGTGTANSH